MDVNLLNFTVVECNGTSIHDVYNVTNPSNLYVTECVMDNVCITLTECRERIKQYIEPELYEWIVIAVYIIIFVVGLVGNGLVCFVVFRTSHMRTIVNIFIVNLAIADFMVLLICLPPSIIADTTETWWLGDVMCKVVPFLQTVSVAVSVLTLGAIAVERYFAICHPLRRRLTPLTVSLFIVAIWTTAICVALPELLYQKLERSLPESVTSYLMYCRQTLTNEEQKYYQIFLMVGLYDVPMCLMFFAYSTIAVRLWRDSFSETANSRVSSGRSETRRGGQFTASRPDNQLTVRKKAAKMLMTIVVLFGVCYLPIHVLNILKYNGTLHTWNKDVIINFALVSRGLCYINSALNPMIYNFMSAKFRQEFRAAFSRCHDRFQEPVKTPIKLYNFRGTRTNGHTRSERYSMNTYTSRQNWNGNMTNHSSSSKRSPF